MMSMLEVAHRSAELRVADAADGFLCCHAKHRELVAVESNGLTVPAQVALGRSEIVER
jgi:hypothetical protein